MFFKTKKQITCDDWVHELNTLQDSGVEKAAKPIPVLKKRASECIINQPSEDFGGDNVFFGWAHQKTRFRLKKRFLRLNMFSQTLTIYGNSLSHVKDTIAHNVLQAIPSWDPSIKQEQYPDDQKLTLSTPLRSYVILCNIDGQPSRDNWIDRLASLSNVREQHLSLLSSSQSFNNIPEC